MGLEDWLYHALLRSVGFRRFVKRVHDGINGIRDERRVPVEQYVPTAAHRANAFRRVWWVELKNVLRGW